MNKFLLFFAGGLGVLCLVLMLSAGEVSDNLAQAQQAQAVIEANRTAQIATTGLAVNASMNSFLLLVMVGMVVVLLAGVAYLVWRDRRRERLLQEILQGQIGEGIHVQGHYRGLGTGSPYAVREHTRQLQPGNQVEQLVQLEILRALRELRGGEASQAQPAARTNDDALDIRWNG